MSRREETQRIISSLEDSHSIIIIQVPATVQNTSVSITSGTVTVTTGVRPSQRGTTSAHVQTTPSLSSRQQNLRSTHVASRLPSSPPPSTPRNNNTALTPSTPSPPPAEQSRINSVTPIERLDQFGRRARMMELSMRGGRVSSRRSETAQRALDNQLQTAVDEGIESGEIKTSPSPNDC